MRLCRTAPKSVCLAVVLLFSVNGCGDDNPVSTTNGAGGGTTGDYSGTWEITVQTVSSDCSTELSTQVVNLVIVHSGTSVRIVDSDGEITGTLSGRTASLGRTGQNLQLTLTFSADGQSATGNGSSDCGVSSSAVPSIQPGTETFALSATKLNSITSYDATGMFRGAIVADQSGCVIWPSDICVTFIADGDSVMITATFDGDDVETGKGFQSGNQITWRPPWGTSFNFAFTDRDEISMRIEVNSGDGQCRDSATGELSRPLGQESSCQMDIRPRPGFSITWDDNEGEYNDPAESAAVPTNDASSAAPFASSENSFTAWHAIAHLNDGFYGNSNSWIADEGNDPAPFAGISFANAVSVSSIAWGRDNGNAVESACGGTCSDRSLGVYTLEFTTVATPDETTPDASWTTIGEVEYLANSSSLSPWLRHRFEVSQNGSAISATGFRIRVSSSGLAIDEVEINPPLP